MAFDTQELTDIALSNIPSGLFLSLPVPRHDDDGTLLDCFVVFSVTLKDRKPNEPSKCIGIDMEHRRGKWLDGETLFQGITFSRETPKAAVMVKGARDEAKSLYGEVREEFALGKPGAASRRYVQLIGQTSTACLMPYYQALCPAIFSEEG